MNLDGGGSGGTTIQPPEPCPPSDPNVDDDGDGFTDAQGDCRDCDNMTNPGALDYPQNGIDEDCNGVADDEPHNCDNGLPIDGSNADAVKSIDLCRTQQGQSWGVMSAQWTFPDGALGSNGSSGNPFGGGTCGAVGDPPNAQSKGLLPDFGPNVKPRAGGSMLSLSSGVARAGATMAQPPATGSSPGGADMCTAGFAAFGFPKDSPSCKDPFGNPLQTANDKNANDAIALEIQVKVPTNSQSCGFDFDYYTYEWPGFVCTQYNDFFVALVASQHPSTPADLNVSFDSQGNPVSVNNSFVEVCDPTVGATNPGGKNFPCTLGTAELQGTGFEPSAATSWLHTQFPVVPGETIKVRFAVWDMGDHILDTTVLIDNFNCGPTGGDEPPTTIPIPK